jgi:hypothetical protein
MRQTLLERLCRPAALHRLVVAVLAPFVLCGCGRSVQLGQVDGTVRLDGQPIGQVMVVFIPLDPHLPQSFGISDDQGRFQLRCNNRSMGAAVGEHRVMLVDAVKSPSGTSKDDDVPEGADTPSSRIPTIYNRANRTPLRQSVAVGSQTITIDIASEKKPA